MILLKVHGNWRTESFNVERKVQEEYCYGNTNKQTVANTGGTTIHSGIIFILPVTGSQHSCLTTTQSIQSVIKPKKKKID